MSVLGTITHFLCIYHLAIKLYCIVLYCIVLYCIVLYCIQEPAVATGKPREGFWEKDEGGWTGKVEISQEEILGSGCSKQGYILTYFRL